MYQADKPFLRPTLYAEQLLVTGILDGTYPPGASLPAERTLAEQLGVTRQTVREVLQRLAKDRWVTIRHGKSTTVNDFWREGGLGILNTLVGHMEFLPSSFIPHLLEARAVFMPTCARAAIPACRQEFIQYLDRAPLLPETAAAYAAYDWELQAMMAKKSKNPVYPLILNDFAPLFRSLGEAYFGLSEGRAASAEYYGKLRQAVIRQTGIESVVRRAMQESTRIWKKEFQQPPKSI